MRKEKTYDRTRFSADVLREALAVFRSQVSSGKVKVRQSLMVEIDGARWYHESEAEFLSDYRRSSADAVLSESLASDAGEFRVQVISSTVLPVTLVGVEAPGRAQIEAVFEVFERNLPCSQLPFTQELLPPEPVVFIGHGRSQQWRDLKDHLHEKHSYRVEAYEIGARAGHAIRDVLEDMLRRSSFAILVMTGEDEALEGGLRARQNVVHEAGLFQGVLGFSRAIVLLEDGAEEFSNIHGIEQVRFSKGNIKETFGEVLATLRREFSAGTTSD